MYLEKTHQVDVGYYRKFFYKKVFFFYFISCIFSGICGLHFLCLPLLIAASEVFFLLRKLRGNDKTKSFVFVPFEVSRFHFYSFMVLTWLFVFGADYAFFEVIFFQQGIIFKNFLKPLESKVASKVIKESGEVVVETTLKDAIQAIYHTGIGCTGVTVITYTGLAVGKFVKKQVSPVVDAIAEAVVEKSLAVAIKGLEVAKDMPNDIINHGAWHGTYFNQVGISKKH